MKTNLHCVFICLASFFYFGCATGPTSETIKPFSVSIGGSNSKHFVVDLPSTFKLKELQGPDFAVYYLNDWRSKLGIGIYDGDHPSGFSPQAGSSPIERVPGRIGTAQVEWAHWMSEGTFRSETFQPGPHIFTAAPSSELRERIEERFETARIVQK